MPVAELITRLADEWRAATHHPFLDGVREGTVRPAVFDNWLVQDARFVGDLLWFQARLLARAPRPTQAVLARGAVALVDELAWFEAQAAERGLDLYGPRLAATDAYAALLARLDATAPGAALAGLWAIERVYLEAWSGAAPGAPEYRGFVARWTSSEFAAYVADLERAADALAGSAPSAEAGALVADVLLAERAFWDMAVEAGVGGDGVDGDGVAGDGTAGDQADGGRERAGGAV